MHRTQRTSLLTSSSRISSLRTAKTMLLAAGLVVGLGVSVGGCNGPLKRMRDMKNRSNEPVNTGLRTIADAPELKLPENEELMDRGDDFGSVRAQIEESARQLNVYFANLEMDGVGDGDVTQVQPVARATEPAPDPVSKTGGQGVVVSPNTSSNTSSGTTSKPIQSSGVRVSLLDGSSDGGGGGGDEAGLPDSSDLSDSLGHESPGVVELVASGAGVDVQVDEVEPMVRKEELARELALILAKLANTSDDPGSAALALASLEMLLPEGSDSLFDQGVLSQAERTSLDAARAFLKSLSSDGSIASPAAVANKLEAIQAKLDAWSGITIKKAALCTRVDGYGWYETFPSYRFIAGKAQPVIVYVELERFAQREIMGPDGQPRYETKLSQRLELYHVADDLNTWNRQAEMVTGETRNRLRDYYLTNQVTLPASLGVGRYHLKVVMRDFIGERVAETIIPIEIVAR